MPTLSYGLNISKKPSLTRPAPAKRKTIFDDDSGPEDGPDNNDDYEAISTLGGLQPSTTSSSPKNSKSSTKADGPNKPSKPPKISQFGDLSTNYSTSKYSREAQSIDPSIYEYDSVYDSLHAKPKSSSSSSAPGTGNGTNEPRKARYMNDLLAAAEIRKRDQLRAKEKMLAKEREAEGDEFADKEKFVTVAYKRQQEEMRKAEAEEAIREKEAEARQRREGGGMKQFYKGMLEKGEQKHEEAVRRVEEAKEKGLSEEGKDTDEKAEKEKSEAELAKEKGAIVNEEGQVVDKRQLLSAGLNPGSAPKVNVKTPDVRGEERGRGRGVGRGGKRESDRERETRLFEEQLLGKRGFDKGDDEKDGGDRASKSRKMEDEILAMIGQS
ncbi:MAG: hypothetical protein LQ342_007381 [Letrouitia transgressa]|nr:MAG: hypothetical protein LQ342_007381 [Letrouitia transgressa]